MRTRVSLLPPLFLLVLLVSPQRAVAWGAEGHEAIGELAASRLNVTAKAAVERILGNDNLAAIATWADEVRAAGRHRGALVNDTEAKRFCAEFPRNGNWHFVNLPLGTAAYTDNGPFSSPDDVVHAINNCIAVLEGRSTKFTPLEALELLVHFVGDIHQPLHVGTGYFAAGGGVPRLVTDPAAARGASDDRGGNLLYYGKSHELHALWDDGLLEKAAKSKDYDRLASLVRGRLKTYEWQTPGDYHQWAEQWATDSVHVAALAYRGIRFERATVKDGRLEHVQIRLEPGYERENAPRALDQVAKAGFHLAELLNRIQWKLPPPRPVPAA